MRWRHHHPRRRRLHHLPRRPNPALAWLPVTWVDIQSQLGTVSPTTIRQNNDGFYFSFTYKAAAPGPETITLTVNDGLAFTQERFEVEESCDYDAFVTTVMHFQVQLDDENFQSLTHVTGSGTMKRDRQGSQFYQGDGTWHLEEIVLSKPAMCVEYYIPPLVMHGPFELDGRLADEGDSVDLILSFLPNLEESFYHGEFDLRRRGRRCHHRLGQRPRRRPFAGLQN